MTVLHHLYLLQDYCGGSASTNGTFRVVTENVPCGTTGTTCSKAIKIFVEVGCTRSVGTISLSQATEASMDLS